MKPDTPPPAPPSAQATPRAKERATPRATITQATPNGLVLAGTWTAFGIGAIEQQLASINLAGAGKADADGSGIEALDTAGAWQLQKFLQRARGSKGGSLALNGLKPEFTRLMDAVAKQVEGDPASPAAKSSTAPAPTAPPAPPDTAVASLGKSTTGMFEQALALLTFIGEIGMAFVGWVMQPTRIRWRPILFNIRTAGFDALPIVGLLAFLLGVVVAYQGADQLRRYGANIFVVDLVGVSMLREFAPLITAIIIAGRSGSAYAAQIGTMAVTEEIDAMRTLGLRPQEVLVLPKLIALLIALPLLTLFADFLGVAGGMLMARAQLGVSFGEFVDRFALAVSPTTLWVWLAKAPVFAAIIAVIGCFQGFRTKGGADSVGRQTTRSVVQAIFLVIVADALFSVAFSALKL